MKLYLFGIFLISSRALAYTTLVPNGGTIQEGMGISIYLQTDNPVVFETCAVSSDEQNFQINVDSNDMVFSNDVFELNGLGKGYCGFRISRAGLTLPVRWTINGTDVNGVSYVAYSNVVVRSPIQANRTVNVVIGSSSFVSCGPDTQLDYCYLYNPKGELVSNGRTCSYSVPVVTVDHIGVWQCSVGLSPYINDLVFSTELVNQGGEDVVTWYNETDAAANLGCQFVNGQWALQYCRFTMPNNESLRIMPGAATDRYSTVGTEPNNYICSLEIKKPLLPHEIGRWKCEMYILVGKTGGFINVRQLLNDEQITVPERTNVSVALGQAYTISCSVPYPLSYCYIMAPNGTVYHSEDRYTLKIGQCEKALVSASTDSGTWVCGRTIEGESIDRITHVDIFIPQLNLTANTNNVETAEGEAVEFLCLTSGNFPLLFCRFISPRSGAYQIDKTTFHPRFSYVGRGIEYGECGIRISSAEPEDSGTWNCVSQLAGDDHEVYYRVNVIVTEPAGPDLASIIGGTVTAVVVVACIVAYVFWRKNRLPMPVISFRRRYSSDETTIYPPPAPQIQPEDSSQQVRFREARPETSS